MKKVIRLNENDIENLVRKIISEEKKSINEGPLGWIRKKFNQDEEIGLLIIKALESGDIEDVSYERVNNVGPANHIYRCDVNGHKVEVRRNIYIRSNDDYSVKVEGERIQLSNKTAKKIFRLMAEIEHVPTLKKRNERLSNIKTSLSRYNLPDEERKQILP